jgi:streptogramin lyase
VEAPAAIPATAPTAKKGRGGLYVALALVLALVALGAQAFYVAKAKEAMKFDFVRNGPILGQGDADGLGRGPQSLAGDAQGNIFFLDDQDRPEMRLQKFDQDMKFVGKYKPLRPDQALIRALDVDVDAKGEVFVLEASGLVLALDNNLRFVNSFKIQVNDPSSMAVSADGHVYVASRGDSKIQIYDAAGRTAGEFGAPGTKSGDLASPVKLAFDGQGRLAVLEDLPDAPRVKVFDKDLKPERSFRLIGVHLSPPLRIAADALGLLYVNDFDGSEGILVYRLDKGKQIGAVKGTTQGEVFVSPGSVGADRYSERVYVHTIPGLIPCAMPPGHLS